MKVKYEQSIEYQALNRLKSIRSNILLRKDLNDIGSYRQVSRALSSLIKKKKLVKIGSGIYAKAYTSKFTDIPLIKNGTDAAFREALKRLGISFEPGSAEKAYNEGKSTQVPVKNIIKLKSRCRRRIGYRNNQLLFEKNINAK
ncbi:MAG: hypothetical protein EPO11_06665 [Gammaproteobacteria bacterium]|nr:MAG: hypothetical protein EPO11_06665 [Gammaproteobacteria bacterium]